MLDRRVRAFEDVTATLGLPVLGVLPKPNARLKLGRQASVADAAAPCDQLAGADKRA